MRLVSISAIPLAEACSMNSAGDWAKALLAPRPSSIAKLAVRNRIAMRLMMGSSRAKIGAGHTPRPEFEFSGRQRFRKNFPVRRTVVTTSVRFAAKKARQRVCQGINGEADK